MQYYFPTCCVNLNKRLLSERFQQAEQEKWKWKTLNKKGNSLFTQFVCCYRDSEITITLGNTNDRLKYKSEMDDQNSGV
jgi:hypothetical protein